jgi:hypothetical protein
MTTRPHEVEARAEAISDAPPLEIVQPYWNIAARSRQPGDRPPAPDGPPHTRIAGPSIARGFWAIASRRMVYPKRIRTLTLLMFVLCGEMHARTLQRAWERAGVGSHILSAEIITISGTIQHDDSLISSSLRPKTGFSDEKLQARPCSMTEQVTVESRPAGPVHGCESRWFLPRGAKRQRPAVPQHQGCVSVNQR